MRFAKVQDYKRRLREKAPYWQFRLRRFSFENMVGVGQGDISFQSPVVVLAGPNGVGKTTLLRAIWAAAAPAVADGGPAKKLKFAHGAATLEFEHNNDLRFSTVTFAGGKIEGLDGVGVDVVHLDAASESKRHQIEFCAFETLDDIINGVGAKALGGEEISEINYISRRDYREITVYEIEAGDGYLPFFEVSYGDDRYDSRTMGAGELATLLLWWSFDRATPNSLLLIEEPETYLSPASQEAFTNLAIADAVESRLNVIITSHSPKIIENVSDEQQIFFFRQGGVIKVIEGLPPPALLETLGIRLKIDTIVLVEDEAAAAFLKLLLERHSPSLSRRIEVSVRSGDGNIVAFLKKLDRPFRNMRIVGAFDGDMRGKIPQEIDGYSTLLPGDKPIERIFRDLAHAQPQILSDTLGSENVNATLFSLEGAESHDWYVGLRSHLGLSSDQLFHVLFRMWERQVENSDAGAIFARELADLLQRVADH
jgi:predicted ATPase